MKTYLLLALTTLSFNSFAYTVVDALYEQPEAEYFYRDPASAKEKFCIIDENQRVFGQSCYSSEELCSKRLEFWKDLPGVKPESCAKM
jgi:hypothetical protein